MAMLDLQSFQQKTYEVRLFDGEVIKLLKPSQKMVIEMMNHEKALQDASNPQGMLDTFVTLIFDILNHNIEGKKFTRAYVNNNFTFEIGLVFIQSYMEFVQEVNNDPN